MEVQREPPNTEKAAARESVAADGDSPMARRLREWAAKNGQPTEPVRPVEERVQAQPRIFVHSGFVTQNAKRSEQTRASIFAHKKQILVCGACILLGGALVLGWQAMFRPRNYAQCVLRYVRAGMSAEASRDVVNACHKLYPPDN